MTNKVLTSTFSTSTNSRTNLGCQVSRTTANGEFVAPQKQVVQSRKKSTAKKVVNVESAVYSYIQAVRALGKTRLTANEIARTLSLSPFEVSVAIDKLSTKGVKIVSR